MAKRAAPHRGIDVHYGDVGDEATDDRPSKTQLKQQSHELQTLGVALAGLSDDALAAIELPESLRDAIGLYRRTKSHEGRRRQMQYVGKLMRSADEDALREAVAAATLGTAQSALALHEAERWRAELIADDDAMTRWLQAHPDTDTQQLRSLVRAARRDSVGLAPEARQPRSVRELFQFIKPMLSGAERA
jgi:ribosome-associated protein